MLSQWEFVPSKAEELLLHIELCVAVGRCVGGSHPRDPLSSRDPHAAEPCT